MCIAITFTAYVEFELNPVIVLNIICRFYTFHLAHFSVCRVTCHYTFLYMCGGVVLIWTLMVMRCNSSLSTNPLAKPIVEWTIYQWKGVATKNPVYSNWGSDLGCDNEEPLQQPLNQPVRNSKSSGGTLHQFTVCMFYLLSCVFKVFVEDGILLFHSQRVYFLEHWNFYSFVWFRFGSIPGHCYSDFRRISEIGSLTESLKIGMSCLFLNLFVT